MVATDHTVSTPNSKSVRLQPKNLTEEALPLIHFPLLFPLSLLRHLLPLLSFPLVSIIHLYHPVLSLYAQLVPVLLSLCVIISISIRVPCEIANEAFLLLSISKCGSVSPESVRELYRPMGRGRGYGAVE